MGVEGAALSIGANLVAAGLLRAGTLTHEEVSDAFREAKFSTELDDIETEFADALKDSIEDIDSKRDTGELTGVVERWDPVVRELYGLEEAAEKDGVDRIMFESEEQAVDEIATAIACNAGFNLADTPGLQSELKVAVTTAYNEAISSFAERVGDTVVERFSVASNIKLHKQLREIQYTLDGLYERFSRRRYDIYPGDDAGRERVAETLERQLGEPENAEVKYVSRPELRDYRDDESLLLLGPGGSGKSRSLIERVRSYQNVAHVISPREAFQNPSDVDFATENFEGDVLLVWDDIHQINPEEGNAVVRKTIAELRDLLTPNGFELHILATGRPEQRELIPGDPDDDDGLWRNIEPVELVRLDSEVLQQVIESAINASEIMISEEAVKAFYRKAQRAEPTPLYVVSVLQNAGDELTEASIDELPESTLDIWAKNFETLSEKPRKVLRSIWILSKLAPRNMFTKPLLRGVYVEVFDDSEAEFDSPFDTVVSQHWLIENETDREDMYGIHDVKHEAIGQDFEWWLVEDLSSFLYANRRRYFSTTPPSTVRVLHSKLAKRMRDGNWGDGGYNIGIRHCKFILGHIDEEDALTHSNCGTLLWAKGDFEEAKRHYERAIDINPSLAQVYYNYGLLLRDEGETEEAKRRFEQATSVDASLAIAHYKHAQILEREEEIEAAEEQYEKYESAVSTNSS
jgi:tetratricopeptide (TPR) repeat protein